MRPGRACAWLLLLAACRQGPPACIPGGRATARTGRVELGVFGEGAKVTVEGLEGSHAARVEVTTVGPGDFTFAPPGEGALYVVVKGTCFDPVLGRESPTPLTLQAIIDPSEESPRVNALTTITVSRVNALLAEGLSLAAARELAQSDAQELLAISPAGFKLTRSATQLRMVGGADAEDAWSTALNAMFLEAQREHAATWGSDPWTPSTDLDWAGARRAVDLGAFRDAVVDHLRAVGVHEAVPDPRVAFDRDGDGLADAVDPCPQSTGAGVCRSRRILYSADVSPWWLLMPGRFTGAPHGDLLLVTEPASAGWPRTMSVLSLDASGKRFLPATTTRTNTRLFGSGFHAPGQGDPFVIDIDHDGDDDVIVFQPAYDRLLFRNDGTGRFEEEPFHVDLADAGHAYPELMQAVFFDDDGTVDFLATSHGAGWVPRLFVRLGGSGGHLDMEGALSGDFVVADVDSDGAPDVLYIAETTDGGATSLRVALQGPRGAVHEVESALSGETSLGAVDFNGDGHLDVLVGGNIQLGDGTGLYAGPVLRVEAFGCWMTGRFARSSPAGVLCETSIATMAPDGGVRYERLPFGDNFGRSFNAGDLNGDGVDDIVFVAQPGPGPSVQLEMLLMDTPAE